MGQHQHPGRLLDLEPAQYLACQRPLRAHSLGGAHPHQAGSGRHVRLPAAPYQGVTVSHQEAVARGQGSIGSGRPRRSVEVGQQGLVAAVEDVEQDRPVATAGCGRVEHRKV